MSEETITIEVESESINPNPSFPNQPKPENITNSEQLTHVRRHSASFGPNKKPVVASRYRGGSVGSCHDMCKYGHRNASHEAKQKLVQPRRTTPSAVYSGEGKGLIKIASDNRKKSVARGSSLPVISLENENQTRPGKEKAAGVEIVGGSSGDFGEIKLKPKRLNTKPPVKKDQCSPILQNRYPNNVKQEGKVKVPEDVPEKTLYMLEPDSKSAVPETLNRNKSVKSSKKGAKPTQNGSFNSRLAKSLFSSSSKSFKWRSEKLEDIESTSKNTDPVNSHRKSKSSIGASKVKVNGKRDAALARPLLTATDSKPKTVQEEDVAGKEKLVNPKEKPSTSTPRSKPGTPKAKREVEPKAKGTKGMKSQNGEGEGFVTVWKMKFRRGKVVALPSGNNSPVKLKFRRPKSLGDSRYGENSGKNSFQSKEIDGQNSYNDGGSVKVVLRRHEASQKKDDVDLNNVIEETASKLVKTRKSKVKALVGAFETVMSLRSRKSSEVSNASQKT